jgi:hypothetical protein
MQDWHPRKRRVTRHNILMGRGGRGDPRPAIRFALPALPLKLIGAELSRCAGSFLH